MSVHLKVADNCLWLHWPEGMINLTHLAEKGSPETRRDMGHATQATLAARPEAQAQNDLRRSFELIKDMVCGEASPRWTDAWTTTQTRGQIADICDVMIRRLAMNSGGEKR